MKQSVPVKDNTITEDLNYLIHLTAFISDSLDMDIDHEIYRNKFIEDILFVNNTLNKIEKKLSNDQIDVKDYTYHLKKIKNVKDNSIVIIENILRKKYRASRMLDIFYDDLKMICDIFKISSEEIKKKLNRKQYMVQPDNQISREELKFLFMDRSDDTVE